MPCRNKRQCMYNIIVIFAFKGIISQHTNLNFSGYASSFFELKTHHNRVTIRPAAVVYIFTYFLGKHTVSTQVRPATTARSIATSEAANGDVVTPMGENHRAEYNIQEFSFRRGSKESSNRLAVNVCRSAQYAGTRIPEQERHCAATASYQIQLMWQAQQQKPACRFYSAAGKINNSQTALRPQATESSGAPDRYSAIDQRYWSLSHIRNGAPLRKSVRGAHCCPK